MIKRTFKAKICSYGKRKSCVKVIESRNSCFKKLPSPKEFIKSKGQRKMKNYLQVLIKLTKRKNLQIVPKPLSIIKMQGQNLINGTPKTRKPMI
jgi:hypothetical protein